MHRNTDAKHIKGQYWITVIIILLIVVAIIAAIVRNLASQVKEKPHFRIKETIEEKQFMKKIQKYINAQNDYINYLDRFNKIKTFAQTEICAEIGRTILNKNGSAVDAGIAMLFCQGVVEPYSSGLGGGFLMLIYIHEDKKVITLDARETATSSVTVNMLKKSNRQGWLPVATPGEGLGLWEAYKRYGKLSWEKLLQPSIKLASEGFPFSKTMSKFLDIHKNSMLTNSSLLGFFLNPATNAFYKEGENCVNIKLSKILITIARKGMKFFYLGDIANEIEKQSRTFNGVINKKDLEIYRVKWSNTLTTIIEDRKKTPFTFHIPPLPSYAIMIPMILNIVQGYYREKIYYLEEKELLYHQVVESMKDTFFEKKRLRNLSFVDYTSYTFLSEHWGLHMREKLNLTHTNFPDSLILLKQIPELHSDNPKLKELLEINSTNIYGATNVAALASNGDAIVACSSLNDPLGSGVAIHGFILNNNMFSFLNQIEHEVSLDQYDDNINQLVYNKRLTTFHSPMMVLDAQDELKLVLSAYGDCRVITSMALVLMHYFLANETLKDAVGKFRYHHGLTSGLLIYEGPSIEVDLENLVKYGHAVHMINAALSAGWPWILVIAYENEDIVTISDPRRK